MLRRTLLAGLAVLGLAATVQAGPMYIALVLDPATTAGSGIATVARQFPLGGTTPTFSVTSTLSGIGKWHLYALDDITGSLGIAGFSVTVNSATGHLNRSTNATYTNYGDVDETVINNTGQAGFSDALVRSGVGANPANPVQGNQVIGSLQDIPGFGQTAGSLNGVPNNPAPGDHRVWGGVTSGIWGNYATSPTVAQLTAAGLSGAAAATTAGKKWYFLGEGSYTGQPSFAATVANYYDNNTAGLHQTPVTAGVGGITTALIGIPEPATLSLLGLALVGGLGLRRRHS